MRSHIRWTVSRLAFLLLIVANSLLPLSPVTAATDYKANVSKLDAVLKSKPNDESAHYYRAVSLQYLGEYRQAKADYDWVISHGRNPGFRQYSQSAVTGLNRVLFGNGVPVASRNPTPMLVAAKTAPTVSASHNGAKPQIYEFYTSWCGVCQKHDQEYGELQNEVSSKIDFQRLNAEDPANASVTAKYAVQAYPTFIFIDSSGNCVFNKAGGFSNAYLKEIISQKFNM